MTHPNPKEPGFDGGAAPQLGKAAKSRKRRVTLPFVPEGPAKIMEGHVQDLAAGRRGGWRQTQSDHLGTYADSGQINEGQLEAARWYEETYRARGKTGETNFERRSASSDPVPIGQAQQEAIRRILAVDSQLSEENRLIVRGVCGEGHHAGKVVRDVTGEDGRHYPIPRFRESLNALRKAIVDARRCGWKFRLQPVNS